MSNYNMGKIPEAVVIDQETIDVVVRVTLKALTELKEFLENGGELNSPEYKKLSTKANECSKVTEYLVSTLPVQ